jgi:hypothetical protein
MKAKPLVIGAAIAALVALGISDLIRKDANGLERAHDRAGLQVNCSTTNIDGNEWGACRYKNGAPASAWLNRGGEWIAANGGAHKVVNRLAFADDLQGIPAMKQDSTNPPTMPTELLN